MLRVVTLASLLAGAGTLLDSAPAAVTARYRIQSHTQTVVDLSGFGVPNQDIGVDMTAWIAVTVSDTTGGRVLHTVLDSVVYEGGAPNFSTEAANSARGGTFHGLLTPDGRVKDIKFTPPDNVFLAAVREMLQVVLARYKPGAQPGERWQDTLEIATSVAGSNTVSKATVDYVAIGPETVAGTPGQKFESKAAYTITGTIDAPQMGAMEVSGTGEGTGTHTVAADGLYGGGTSTAKLNQVLRTAMAPLPIPVTTTATTQVTRLP